MTATSMMAADPKHNSAHHEAFSSLPPTPPNASSAHEYSFLKVLIVDGKWNYFIMLLDSWLFTDFSCD